MKLQNLGSSSLSLFINGPKSWTENTKNVPDINQKQCRCAMFCRIEVLASDEVRHMEET